ncbi:uncharacterized protein BO97DRAFT_461863 [Aspergillus homomorphus CBS 101889]|uniref:Uncharacterized protein n=1 Tax=Aspergillus homomorphus (strain CBS 101889) TaxID=1450537 RepID=A0A395HLT8_ASPHC|nr:hypothetical protein BO97DRAFT_461863 [Aspergillus homomorphus CBS 101889]RAL08195.1 hypothetical protein BO97DRAFT_461863 [Aspergillus homomorphus CBS 101889]
MADYFTYVPGGPNWTSTQPMDIIVDEPYHCAMTEEKEQEIVEAENEKLDQLQAKFTRGFDPSTFGNEVISALPSLARSTFPGTYEHFLMLLFTTDDEMHDMQVQLEQWLLQRYGQVFDDGIPRIETNIADETYFAVEIETLRRLLEPLRGDCASPVYWHNARRASPTKARKQLEASIKVVNVFKKDLIAAIQFDPQERKIVNPLPISVERSAFVSLKQIRTDACKGTLYWDEYNQSSLVLTLFYHAYKGLVCRTNPTKARKWGWLPPETLEAPRPSSAQACLGDLAHWPLRQEGNNKYDLLIRTALWLALGRGLPAVHLFCDCARVFTSLMPPEHASPKGIVFLRRLTQLRLPVEAIRSNLKVPVPFQKRSLKSDNHEYFEDVWRSDQDLEKDLARNVTLYGMDTAKAVRQARPPPPRRSFKRQTQLIKDALTVEEDFTHVWPRKDAASKLSSLICSAGLTRSTRP